MLMIGTARIGNEPALRYTTNNDPVLDFSLAFDYGKKGSDGKRPTQWINATFWGKRAESIAQYVYKGQKVFVEMSDPHIETYAKKDGTEGVSLRTRIFEIELIDFKLKEQVAPQPEVTQQDSDIPF